VLVRVFDKEEKFIYGRKLQTYADHYVTQNSRGRNVDNYRKSGLAYLYYVLLNQKLQGLEGFDVETTFKVSLESKSLEDLRKGVVAFWLFVHLGGLGSRARRGAGCIQVTGIVDKENCLLDEEKKSIISFLPDEANSIVSFYTENYKKCIGILQKPNTPEGYSKGDDKYSTLTSNEIYVSTNHFGSWEDALDDIGKIMKRIRKRYEDDGNRQYKLADLPMKAVFGLPIQIQRAPNFEGYYVDLLDSQRRASPLIISVVRIKRQDIFKYHWVLTYLDGEFAEEGNNVVVRNSKKQIHKDRNGEDFSWKIISDDYKLIDTFLDKLSKTQITI
jgi:CRISPR-associated protein Cmr1